MQILGISEKDNFNNVKTAVGIGAGAITANIISKPVSKIIRKAVDRVVLSKMEKISDEDLNKVVRVSNEAYNQYGLCKKGVLFCDVENIEPMGNFFKNITAHYKNFIRKTVVEKNENIKIPSFKWFANILPAYAKYYKRRMCEYQAKNDINIFYDYSNKEILYKNGKMMIYMPHELGHAINHNLSKTGQLLIKCRPLKYAVLPMFAVALLTPKKNEPKGIAEKSGSFVKNNIGKLAFLSFLPLLSEEFSASLRGLKIANCNLPEKLCKTMAKHNAYGFWTYLCGAIFTALGVATGVKVKDLISKQ